MTSREHARPVWVDLAAVFGRSGSASEGIDLDQPAPGGLVRWIRTSGGTWVGVVNVVVPMTDGSTIKYSEQLVPARALRPSLTASPRKLVIDRGAHVPSTWHHPNEESLGRARPRPGGYPADHRGRKAVRPAIRLAGRRKTPSRGYERGGALSPTVRWCCVSALVALLADLLKLSPAAVGATLLLFVVVLLAVSTRHVFRYLERRSDNKLIARHLDSNQPPQAGVIQAIRGTAIADAATASSETEVVDAEVDGLARRLTGWMRELKPPGG